MYEYLAESLRLIEHGVPDEPVGLSRRRRLQPVAVDVDGDVAVTRFLCRAHGGAQEDAHVLSREDGEWRLLGGGSGGGYAYDELLRVPRCDAWDGHALTSSGGGTALGRGDRARISHASLTVCQHVAEVRAGSADRMVTVPCHRRLAVVWRGHGTMPVRLLDADEAELGRLTLGAR